VNKEVLKESRHARRRAARLATAAARKEARLVLRAERKKERLATRSERREARRVARELRAARRIQNWPVVQRGVAGLMRVFFGTSRLFGRRAASRFAGDFMREVGPFLHEHKIGLANLEASFPEKSPEERAQILSGVWDNLARATVEYAFLADLVAAFDPDRPTGGLIEHSGVEHAVQLRDDGKPGIVFGAHLANWELPAALSAKIGMPVRALYRAPTNVYVAEEMERRRAAFTSGLVVSERGAAREIAAALRHGEHVGIIVDQRITDGQSIPFLGRPSPSNPIIGALARLFECPVIGTRTIRLPDGRFRIEVTPVLQFPRDARGRIDAEAANVMVHGIVEEWVREYPGQWLWLHERWRNRRRRRRPEGLAQGG
jgi:KDO2-lipid IV(A) lauroyltransferase